MIFGSLSFLESVSQSWQKYFHLNKTLNFLNMFSILQPLPNFCSSFTKVIAFGEMLQWFKEGGTSNSSSFYSLTVNVYNMIRYLRKAVIICAYVGRESEIVFLLGTDN